MTTTIKPVKRSIVSLKLPVTLPAFITMVKGIVAAMTNNKVRWRRIANLAGLYASAP